MLEDDVDVLAPGELPDALAQALPLLGVLGVLVLPEAVVLVAAVDDEFRPHGAAQICLVVARHDAHGDRAAVDGVLRGVGAQAAGRAPDQDDVALLHASAVARDKLAVSGRIDQAGRCRFLPGQMRGLGQQLVGLDQGDLCEAAEVGLEPPDALLGIEHRVVVAERAFEIDR